MLVCDDAEHREPFLLQVASLQVVLVMILFPKTSQIILRMTKIKNVYVKLVLFYMKLKQCNSALKVEIMCYLFTSIIPQDNRLKEICTFLQWKQSFRKCWEVFN